MAINWKQLYEQMPNASYWYTRYRTAKGILLGMSNLPRLMSDEEWSSWYDENIEENDTAKVISEKHEKKVNALLVVNGLERINF